MAFIWLNGNFVEEDRAVVSLRDTGLLQSAGVFTTMRSYEGKVFRLAQHLKRLRDSCEALSISLPYDDTNLTEAAGELLSRNGLTMARLRLTATRGQARSDHSQGLRLEPNVFLTAVELEPYPAEFYERGMTVVVVDEQKLNPYDIQAGHKTLNYFSRLAALRDAGQRAAGEALWFNVHNYLESGSISNVFIVKAEELLTPPVAYDLSDKEIAAATPYPRSAVLPGITRALVIEQAKAAGIPVRATALTIHDLLEADEVFLTNSIMGIMPVCRIERRAVGNDKPGKITMRLSARYAVLSADHGDVGTG